MGRLAEHFAATGARPPKRPVGRSTGAGLPTLEPDIASLRPHAGSQNEGKAYAGDDYSTRSGYGADKWRHDQQQDSNTEQRPLNEGKSGDSLPMSTAEHAC